MELRVKPEFETKYRKILGDEYDTFVEFMKGRIPKTIRANTLKVNSKSLCERLVNRGWELRKVPWFDSGFVVEKAGEDMTKSPEHYLGYFYMQESASMVPPLVLNPEGDDVVLDMAAAPGSKTTQMAQMMGNTGLIVANDMNVQRLKALRGNIQKMGVTNTVVTSSDMVRFSTGNIKFKKILLDAPCSASGNIVTTWRVMDEWSEKTVTKMGRYQKRLIAAAAKCLDDDGVLVYSTCSMEPEEDEEVVDFAVRELGMRVEKSKVDGLKSRSGLTDYGGKSFDESVSGCIRLFPHDNGTEGFFVCRLTK